MASFILIHPIVWPQYTNVTDRQDRKGQTGQRSDNTERTVLQTVAQKLTHFICHSNFYVLLLIVVEQSKSGIGENAEGNSKMPQSSRAGECLTGVGRFCPPSSVHIHLRLSFFPPRALTLEIQLEGLVDAVTSQRIREEPCRQMAA